MKDDWGRRIVILTRTPEGQPDHCPIRGSDARNEPTDPAGEAPCPNGGHLLGFDADALGPIETIRIEGPRLDPGWLDHLANAIADRAGLSLVLDFGEIRERSSASLGGLIQLKRRLGTDAGRWIVRLLDPGLREVFRITRLDAMFDLDA